MSTPITSTCEITSPSIGGWVYTILVHYICCTMFITLPLGTGLYYLRHLPPSLRQVLGVAIGVGVASATGFGNYMIKIDHPATWMGPFLLKTCGFSCFFKSVNAGFGQYPEGADANLQSWLLWFTIIPEPDFVKGKPRKAASGYMYKRVRNFLIKIAALGALVSVLLLDPKFNLPFPENTVPEWLGKVLSGFVHLWLLYLFAAMCLDLVVILTAPFTGIHYGPGFLNPLLRSRSLKENWGVRWNRPVQVLLKRTAYIPCRKQGFGPETSAAITFFVSGLLHEYNFWCHNRVAYEPGKAMTFFVGMGFLMFLETFAYNQLPTNVQKMVAKTPTIIIAIMISLFVSWPFEHYFIRSWLDSGMMEAAAELLPHVNCVAPGARV